MNTRKRILVIEDNDVDAVIIEEALLMATPSVDVIRFEDGRDVLAHLLTGDVLLPDVILLDLNLPKSQGLDILRQIRYSPKLSHIPIGILTGSELVNDELRASNLGASRYIHKPKSYDDFVSGVRDVVERMLAQGTA